MNPRPECLVMAKPAGPGCNLRCGYCYYIGKESLFPEKPWRMPEDLLENFISQRIEASPGPTTHFEWHGGEPTILGLEYFRSIARIQRSKRPRGRTITNGLQTNGMLLDDAWADFLKKEGFSVGLSIDGPAELHDEFRRTVEGGATHARVVTAFRLLQQRGVFCNVLCVLHAGNTQEPDAVYDFFRQLGVTHLQFLPLVSPWPGGGVSPATAGAEALGAFLCRVFDRWIREDVGKLVIQTFDEALRPLYGIPHSLCIHRETCGDVAVLEHDGGFYACDHFVDADHLIGNLRERRLADMMADPRMSGFGRAKRDALPQTCRECDVLSSCNGGCPKDRIDIAPNGEPGLNYLCPGLKRFFRHSGPDLTRLAAHMKAGRRLRAFKSAGA
ncbi:MAG: anaerobic sulfatase maturase [Spirochaetia bacterium]